MKNTNYAKPKFYHGDFRPGNLYEITNETEYTIELKVKDKLVIAKKDNFIIVPCIFNPEEKKYLITYETAFLQDDRDLHPFFTDFYNFENNYAVGMIVFDLHSLLWTDNGYDWYDLPEDTL